MSVSHSLIFWAERDIYQLTISWFPPSLSSSPLRSVPFLPHFISFLTKIIVGLFISSFSLPSSPSSCPVCGFLYDTLYLIQCVWRCVSNASNHFPYGLVYTSVLYEIDTTYCLSSVVGHEASERGLNTRLHFIVSSLHTSTFQLLDMPWSQVSSFSPHGSCLHFFSPTGFRTPTARRLFIEYCCLTLSRFQQVNLQFYKSMHSAGLKRTNLTYTRLENNLIRDRGDRCRLCKMLTGENNNIVYMKKHANSHVRIHARKHTQTRTKRNNTTHKSLSRTI